MKYEIEWNRAEDTGRIRRLCTNLTLRALFAALRWELRDHTVTIYRIKASK